MEIKCLKCNHVWNYKGTSDYYVTCPRCYKKINLRRIKNGKPDRIRREL